ncbi:hypothetical protein AO262_36970, partial [Pseudomonas fluorescens ABAC62]
MSTPFNGSTLNTAGSADLSFGNTTPKKGTVIDVDTAGISRVLSDGSIITVGLFSNDTGRHIGITKYTPTGDVEFVFRETPADEREVLIDMLVQPDDNPLLLAARFDGTAA